MVNVLEDGRNPNGYQVLGYCGKASYDPQSRRVLWMGTGASSGSAQNNAPGAYVWNTRTTYDERSNTWSAARAFRGADEGASAEAIGHQYDGNCIDVSGRRLYKLKKDTNRVLVFDLDSNVMLSSIQGPSGVSVSSTWGALEVVSSRGTQGALWLATWNTANTLKLWEFDLSTRQWAQLLGSMSFGGITDGPVLSFNPRAFGGAGGVMLGNESGAWTIRTDTLAVAQVPLPGGRRLDVAAGEASGFCRDPVGPGWIKISDNTKRAYRWNGSQWETRATAPTPPGNWFGDFITVPIDASGVIWLISYTAGPAGWLYKP